VPVAGAEGGVGHGGTRGVRRGVGRDAAHEVELARQSSSELLMDERGEHTLPRGASRDAELALEVKSRALVVRGGAVRGPEEWVEDETEAEADELQGHLTSLEIPRKAVRKPHSARPPTLFPRTGRRRFTRLKNQSLSDAAEFDEAGHPEAREALERDEGQDEMINDSRGGWQPHSRTPSMDHELGDKHVQADRDKRQMSVTF